MNPLVRFTSSGRLGIAAAVAMLLVVPEVHAGCAITDIACLIDELISPIEKDVKKVEKDISGLKNDIVPPMKNTLDALEDGVDEVETTFENLENGATQIVGEFAHTIEVVPGRILGLSEDLVTRMEDGLKYIEKEIDTDSADFRGFVGSDGCSEICHDFRKRTADMIRKIGEAADASNEFVSEQLVGSGGTPPSFTRTMDTETWAKDVESAPGVVLYPLYLLLNTPPRSASGSPGSMGLEGWEFELSPVAISSSCSGHNYCAVFNAVDGLVERFETGLAALKQNGYGKRPASVTLCGVLFTEPAVPTIVSGAAATLYFIAMIADAMVAGFMESAGLAGFDMEIDGGYAAGPAADVGFEARPTRRLAHVIRAFAKPVEAVGLFTLLRVRDCRNRLEARMVICAIESGSADFRDDCRTKVLAGDEFGF